MRLIKKIPYAFHLKHFFLCSCLYECIGRLAKSISASLGKFLNCTVSYQFFDVVDGRTAVQLNFPG